MIGNRIQNMNGILEQTQNSNKQYYTELTLKDLNDFLIDISQKRSFSYYNMYFGSIGYIMYELSNSTNNTIYYYVPKRNIKSLYFQFNLNKKNNIYNYIVRPCTSWNSLYTIEVRKGTEIINTFDSFNNLFKVYEK